MVTVNSLHNMQSIQNFHTSEVVRVGLTTMKLKAKMRLGICVCTDHIQTSRLSFSMAILWSKSILNAIEITKIPGIVRQKTWHAHDVKCSHLALATPAKRDHERS